MTEYVFVFKLKPVPKGRPRFSKYGGTYTPKETVEFENALKWQMKSQYRGKPIDLPIAVEIEFIFKSPKKPKNTYPRGDVDNYCKGVLDAMNDILWCDDSQVVALSAFKRYGIEDKIILTLFSLDPDQETPWSAKASSARQKDNPVESLRSSA